MAVEKDNASRYAWGGVVVLCLLILLGWFASRQSSSLDQQQVKVELPKPQAREAPAFEPTDDLTNEEMATRTDDSAPTNAVAIYRQAFDLFDQLSREQKDLLYDWQTNVDASVESELCEKLRPICNLMHQALAVTNCDWGIEPTDYSAKLHLLNHARPVGVAAIWSAARCHSKDASEARQDVLSVLRLGRSFSDAATIDCLTDIALQTIVSSYIAKNLGSFRGEYAQLAAALDDPSYERAPSRAMEHEANAIEYFIRKLESLPGTDAENEFSRWAHLRSANPPEMDQTAALSQLKEIADSLMELAKALASSSDAAYEAWLNHSTELQASNQLAKDCLSYDQFVEKARAATVNRALVVAGLAVAQDGVDALASHPDPSSEQRFVYTETTDGFQLQSTYQVNGKPIMMQFKSR